MSRRTKILILIAFVAMAVLVILAILFGKRRAGEPEGGESATPPPALAIPALTAPELREPLGTAASSGEGAKRAPSDASALARAFVERLGSYSNQSDFENLESLYPFMTARLRRETETHVASQRSSGTAVASSYSGVTTSVINLVTLSQSATDLQFKLTTQRRQSGGPLETPRVYYQPMEVTLLKEGEAWKVDRAEWK